jgi:hypothetical protein
MEGCGFASTQKGGLAASVMAQASSLINSWWCVITRLTSTFKWWTYLVLSTPPENKSSKVITVHVSAVKGEALRAGIGRDKRVGAMLWTLPASHRQKVTF